MNQKYLDAVEYLLANPKSIAHAWICPTSEQGGCLFAFVSSDGKQASVDPDPLGSLDYSRVGCLSQIACLTHKSRYPNLDEAIQADSRLKIRLGDVSITPGFSMTREELMAFAEWQDRLDKEIRNVDNPTMQKL